MRLTRFLSHIYFSFYGIDKFFHRFSADSYSKPKNWYVPIIADSLIETTICGYIFGALRFFYDFIGIFHRHEPWEKRVAVYVFIPLGVFLFALVWRKISASKTYEHYFSEFDNDANYDHFSWNLISFFAFVIAVALLLYSIFTTFPL